MVEFVNVPDPNLFAGEIKLFDGMKLKNIIDNYDEVPPASAQNQWSRARSCGRYRSLE